MPARRLLISLILTLMPGILLAAPAKTEPKPATPQPLTTSHSKEELLAQPPKGWINVFRVNIGDTRVADFVPKGQTRHKWTARLSFESYTKLLDSDPLTVINSEVEYEKKHCSFARPYNLFSGYENNYETAFKLIVCGKNLKDKKGEITLFKAIKGQAYFYVIRLVRRIPPFDADKTGFSTREIALWSHYFSKFKVCEPGSSKHPCPKPAAHSPGKSALSH